MNRVRECRRVESLGCDRNYSRYWLFQSHPEALFVEKITSFDAKTLECTEFEGEVDQKLENGAKDALPRYQWAS